MWVYAGIFFKRYQQMIDYVAVSSKLHKADHVDSLQ